MVPLNDPVNQLIHADDGGSVESVMIGGRMVYEGRRFTTVDSERLIAGARAARLRRNAIAGPRRELVLRLEDLVARHCACFASRAYPVRRMGQGVERD